MNNNALYTYKTLSFEDYWRVVTVTFLHIVAALSQSSITVYIYLHLIKSIITLFYSAASFFFSTWELSPRFIINLAYSEQLPNNNEKKSYSWMTSRMLMYPNQSQYISSSIGTVIINSFIVWYLIFFFCWRTIYAMMMGDNAMPSFHFFFMWGNK